MSAASIIRNIYKGSRSVRQRLQITGAKSALSFDDLAGNASGGVARRGAVIPRIDDPRYINPNLGPSRSVIPRIDDPMYDRTVIPNTREIAIWRDPSQPIIPNKKPLELPPGPSPQQGPPIPTGPRGSHSPNSDRGPIPTGPSRADAERGWLNPDEVTATKNIKARLKAEEAERKARRIKDQADWDNLSPFEKRMRGIYSAIKKRANPLYWADKEITRNAARSSSHKSILERMTSAAEAVTNATVDTNKAHSAYLLIRGRATKGIPISSSLGDSLYNLQGRALRSHSGATQTLNVLRRSIQKNIKRHSLEGAMIGAGSGFAFGVMGEDGGLRKGLAYAAFGAAGGGAFGYMRGSHKMSVYSSKVQQMEARLGKLADRITRQNRSIPETPIEVSLNKRVHGPRR